MFLENIDFYLILLYSVCIIKKISVSIYFFYFCIIIRLLGGGNLKKQEDKINSINTIYHKYGVDKSALIFHNYGNDVSSFVELTSPYMLLYEQYDLNANRFTLMEFSDIGHYYVYTSHDELKALGEQSLHKHEFYEITYVLSGKLRMQLEDDTYIFSAGDCCLCNQSIRHAEHCDSDCEFLLIMLQDYFFKELIEDHFLSNTEHTQMSTYPMISLLTNANMNSKRRAKNFKEFITFYQRPDRPDLYNNNLALINNILDELTSQRPGGSFIFKGYLCRLLSQFDHEENYITKSKQVETPMLEDLFIHISFTIEEHMGNITRTELETLLGYNGDYLTRIIKHFTGKNFVEYSKEFSIREAEKRLLETHDSIGQICIDLGYTNRTYFNKLFQKKYGMTPRDYRQMHLR